MQSARSVDNGSTAGRSARSSTLRRSTSRRRPSILLHQRTAALAKHTAGAPEGEGDDELHRLLFEKEAKILELQKQLEVETRRCNVLETELDLSLATSQRAEGAHQQELTNMEEDVLKAAAERRSLIGKLQQMEVVEDTIRELYVQMKDRVAENDPTPEQLQEEKAALKGENILVVLGALHATLENLWIFKVEAEDDLRGVRQSRADEHLGQMQEMQEIIRKKDAELATLKGKKEGAEERLQDELASKHRLLSASKEVVKGMEVKHQDLIDALQEAEGENESLRKCLSLSREEGRRRDGLVLKNKQLESARHFDRLAQDRELRQMKYHHDAQMQELDKEISCIGRMMRENEDLRAQLEDKNRLIHSLKRGVSKTRLEDLESTVQRLVLQIEYKEEKEAELSKEVKKLEGKLAMKSRKGGKGFRANRGRAYVVDNHKPDNKDGKDEDGVLVDVESMQKQAKIAVQNVKEELKKEPFIF